MAMNFRSMRFWLGLMTLSLALGLSLYVFSTGALASPSPTPTLTRVSQRAVVGGEGARLRTAPYGQILEELPLGAAVWVTGRTPDDAWLQVSMADGGLAWVAAEEVVLFGLDLLPVLDVSVPTPTPIGASASIMDSTLTAWVNTQGRNLNLRQGPGTNFGIVGVARPGQSLAVLGRDASGDWLLVALPGTQDVAWVAAHWLSLDDDVDQLPVSEEQSRAPVVQGAAGYQGPATGLRGRIVFQTASGGAIMVYDLATGHLRQLTTGMDPAISPDGHTVAFVRDGGGDAGLYLVDMDGTHERRILAQNQLRTPAWSPDGAWIVFSRVVGQDTCREVGHGVCLPDAPWLIQFPLKKFDVRGLSLVDSQGHGFRDLPTVKHATAADWGPGGVLYQAPEGLQIIEHPLADDASTRPFLSDIKFRDPTWSPDGQQVAWVSLEKDHREIFRAQADGSQVRPLTHPGDFIEDPRAIQHVAPAWSPDGRFLVYVSDEAGPGQWALYVMDANGAHARRLPISMPLDYRFQGEQVVDWGK